MVGLSQDPSTLNPAITSMFAEHQVAGQIFNAMMEYECFTIVPVPELAQSWQASPDGLTYTFNLVRNATWHDGVKFTSADIKFTFEEVLPKYHPRGPGTFGANIKSVETPDEYTAVFKLKGSFAPLISMMGLWYAGVIPKHIYEGTDIVKNPRNMDNPIGTGPFLFKEWVRGSHIRLVRNPNYWMKDRPYLDEVIFRIIPDDLQRVRALETGDVDYIPMMVPYSEISRLAKKPGLKYVNHAAFGAMYQLQFNLLNPILSKVKVRHGIAHAIDKKFIVDTVTFGLENIATGPLCSTIGWAYNPDVPKYEFDKKRAEALFDEAGYPKKEGGTRFSIRIVIPRWTTDDVRAAEVIRDQLKDVGIDAQLIVLESAVDNEQTYMKHDFDIHIEPRLSTGPDPNQIRYLYHSENIRLKNPTPGMWNIPIYNNSRVDQLFDQGARETDMTKRAAIYKELQRIIVGDLPVLTIKELSNPHIFKENVVGVPAGPYGGARERLHKVWLMTASATTTVGVTTPTTVRVTTPTTTVAAPDTFSQTIVPVVAVIVIIAAVWLIYKKRERQSSAK